MLRWAREWRGRSIEQAAKHLKKKPEDIASWESPDGKSSPTVRQARELADFYDRAFLEFFLPEPPEIPSPSDTVDYRLYTGDAPPEPSWELTDLRQWAESSRANAMDLFADLEEEIPEIPGDCFFTVAADPDIAAASIRTKMEFKVNDQTGLDSGNKLALTTLVRKKIEDFGVMVLRHSGLKALRVRGLCIANYPLPVIVYSNEAPAPQAFTIAHEFAHVLLRAGGISGNRTKRYEEQPVEKWCDRFAAAFLMPETLLAAYLGERPTKPHANIEDAKLIELAKLLRISPHATLIRLVNIGYVAADYYWNVKRAEFEAQDAAYKGPPIQPKFYGVRYRTAMGPLYTSLVLSAWDNGILTNHNAAEYMGIKNLSHMDDLRKDRQGQ